MKCGRVDLKMAPYDTIQFQRTPLWLRKDCSEFGPPVFSSSHGTSVPLSSILPQVQLEAILWGLGTALGELPPYFISRAGLSLMPLCPYPCRIDLLTPPAQTDCEAIGPSIIGGHSISSLMEIFSCNFRNKIISACCRSCYKQMIIEYFNLQGPCC